MNSMFFQFTASVSVLALQPPYNFLLAPLTYTHTHTQLIYVFLISEKNEPKIFLNYNLFCQTTFRFIASRNKCILVCMLIFMLLCMIVVVDFVHSPCYSPFIITFFLFWYRRRGWCYSAMGLQHFRKLNIQNACDE